MKFEVQKEKISDVLTKADRVSGKNSNLPILSCVLLNLKKNNLTISSTNLDIGIIFSVVVKGSKDGVVAVPSSTFSNLLSQIGPNSIITIEEKDNNLLITTKTLKSVIKTQNHSDFPIIPKIDAKTTITVPATSFSKGIQAVSYSSATSTMKPELSSIFISSEDNNLIFAATDSFRLAEKKVMVKNIKEFGHLLIPFRNAIEISKILEGYSENVEISISNNQISLLCAGDMISSRVVEGNFPDYKQIVPKESKTEIVVIKKDLTDSLKVANIFMNSLSQITLEADSKRKLFSITTENPNLGINTSNIDAVVKGDAAQMNFNYKYVADCFQSINSDSVTLSLAGSHKPMTIRGVGDNSFFYIVMPMNK